MLAHLALVVFASAPVFSVSASPGLGEKQTFEVRHLVTGERYELVTRGLCKGPRRRHRLRDASTPSSREKPAPFGTEYRVMFGRLEFSVDTDERVSEPFRAEAPTVSLTVENRSSANSNGVHCALTSIVIRPYR